MAFLSTDLISDVTDYLSANWFKVLIFANLLALSGGFFAVRVTEFFAVRVTEFGMTADSALFHLGGWHLAGGGTPYVDFWDINPPLPFFVAALVSLPIRWLPVQSEMQTILYLGNAVSAAVVMATSLLTAGIAHRSFSDELAALTAGLSIYLSPSLLVLPATGIRPKYFLLAFGMASFYAYLREWPWMTGLFAALACTAHQAGLLYLLLATGFTGYRDDIVAAGKVIGAAAGVVVVLLVPFLYWDAATTMIVQTVFVSFIVDVGSVSWIYNLIQFLEVLGYSSVVLPIAVLGWWKLATRNDTRTLWIPLGAGTFLGYNLFLDMNGPPDVWMFIIFLVLGLAAVIADSSRERSLLIVAGIGVVGLTMLVVAYPDLDPPLYGVFDVLYSFVPTPELPHATPPSDLPTMTERHWSQTVEDTCHWRLSDIEIAWIEHTDGDYYESTCKESLRVIWDSR